jgi:hypothetical protein
LFIVAIGVPRILYNLPTKRLNGPRPIRHGGLIGTGIIAEKTGQIVDARVGNAANLPLSCNPGISKGFLFWESGLSDAAGFEIHQLGPTKDRDTHDSGLQGGELDEGEQAAAVVAYKSQ